MNKKPNFYPLIANMQGMSVSAAMRMAFACSDVPDDEVAASMGWSSSVANRITSNGDYWPSLPTLPRFCNVLGNTIIVQWVVDNSILLHEEAMPMDAIGLLADLRSLMKEISDVLEEGEKALADNHVSPDEARRVARQLDDVFTVGSSMLSRLQATINQARKK